MMESKEFNNKIKSLQKIYSFVTDNPYSDFYSLYYKNKGHKTTKIIDYDNFLKIPSLDKDVLLEVPMDERTFVSQEKIKGFSVTSGTTKNKRVLMLPFSDTSESFFKVVCNPLKMKRLGVNKIIYATSPLHGMVRHMIYESDGTMPFVLSKPDNLILTANMIKEASIEGIISTPTILELLLAELKKLKLSRQIKWVCLAGEHCSKEKRDLISQALPNAYIEMVYGSAEAGIIGVQCSKIKKETNHFHPVEEVFLEVLDNDGKPQKDNAPGGIFITSLTKKAFPLIRYNIKDMAISKTQKCSCGASETFTLLGRSDFDSVKIKGTLVHAEAVERALALLADKIEPDYKLSIYEKKAQRGILPELVLDLVPKENLVIDQKAFTKELETLISENLWLSPQKSLADLVNIGAFLPLKINLVNKIAKDSKGKTRSIHNFTI